MGDIYTVKMQFQQLIQLLPFTDRQNSEIQNFLTKP